MVVNPLGTIYAGVPGVARGKTPSSRTFNGRLAQLVRAPALQAGGRRFESYIAHHLFMEKERTNEKNNYYNLYFSYFTTM